jgi:hypothetical protein
MRRARFTLAGVLLLGLVPFVVSGCAATCACADTPDPNWTPPPVLPADAAAAAARAAGVPSMTAVLTTGPDRRSWFVATAAGTVAFVDAESGSVLEVVLEEAMPIDDVVSATADQATVAAKAFIVRAGQPTTTLVAKVTEQHRGGVAILQVDWAYKGSSNTVLRVLANARTGEAFVFVNLWNPTGLVPPVIGRARAIEIALAADGVEGDQVLGAELAIGIGELDSSWTIGLGVPTATQADVYGHGAAISVNAVTGEATILKSDASPKP